MISDIGLIAAALAFAGGAIGAAIAEASALPAAIGMISEDKNKFGLGVVMCVLPESIAIFGLVLALIMLFVI